MSDTIWLNGNVHSKAPEYDLETQARIPSTLCAIHNFISVRNPTEGPIPGAEVFGGGGSVINDDPEAAQENQDVPDIEAEGMERDYNHIAQGSEDEGAEVERDDLDNDNDDESES
ncbi:hypothetical protein M404DRAFT_19164 [Pisolithus tinctorius Marx 270]|uniref:Uncharacterized protein n=1 Tax=Pisolithus tinctorius Marx 270 TaxID=870435 RepID=A0A0C3PU69_PISTI|nr:hypothetical protein M404DRAFT_19164 [Pisolithus tinctorius Marx 270]